MTSHQQEEHNPVDIHNDMNSLPSHRAESITVQQIMHKNPVEVDCFRLSLGGMWMFLDFKRAHSSVSKFGVVDCNNEICQENLD